MKRVSYMALFSLLFVAAIVGCGEDRTHEYYEMTEENQWTYSKMKEVYLWSDDIKEPERNGFFSSTSKFFASLLSSNDKLSYFTDTVSVGTYGMTYAVMRDPLQVRPSKVYALVLYVEPESPAAVAGIERGVWISSVDGMALTLSKQATLLSGPEKAIGTEIMEYNETKQSYSWVAGDTLALPASMDISRRAIYLDSVYTLPLGKVGYMVVDNFDDENFLRDAQDVLQDFLAEGVDGAILDFRYCMGGSIVNAAALASSFVSENMDGQEFCSLVGNSGIADTVYCYPSALAPLHEKVLYIIQGTQSAGAAELFIKAVKGATIEPVVTIGEKTAGVNIVTERFLSPYGFSINPATSYVAIGDTILPMAGLLPDYEADELLPITDVRRLGDENETLLRCAFDIASGAAFEASAGERTIDASVMRSAGKHFKK